MKQLFNSVIASTNYQQLNNQIKKYFIYECEDILETTVINIETLLNNAENYLETIDYDIMSNSDEIKEAKWLLEHPIVLKTGTN